MGRLDRCQRRGLRESSFNFQETRTTWHVLRPEPRRRAQGWNGHAGVMNLQGSAEVECPALREGRFVQPTPPGPARGAGATMATKGRVGRPHSSGYQSDAERIRFGSRGSAAARAVRRRAPPMVKPPLPSIPANGTGRLWLEKECTGGTKPLTGPATGRRPGRIRPRGPDRGAPCCKARRRVRPSGSCRSQQTTSGSGWCRLQQKPSKATPQQSATT